MKRKKLLGIVVMVVLATMFSSCRAYKDNLASNLMAQLNGRFQIIRSPQQQFYDLNTGLQVRVEPTQPQPSMDKNIRSMSNLGVFQTPTITYIKAMGFKEMSSGQDYTLTIKQSKVDINTWNGQVDITLGVKMTDASGSIVFNQETMTSEKNAFGVDKALNEAYTRALEQINWVQIASFLKTEKLAKKEPNKQVEGLGTTALEQTIIRWDIQSRPQGADIFWRVVSKTPEVKSTNNKYLTTTPYEATKALDIRGLTYQTSSNVRIILRCEKDGYMPQEKEYDVRMVLDQEEISAFFRLVKEE
ncbi:MAG: hypothetical protein J6T88_07270 [Bacteroidales bacterium]|nr:hypothetical protein [Bacteroidales bacterium]